MCRVLSCRHTPNRLPDSSQLNDEHTFVWCNCTVTRMERVPSNCHGDQVCLVASNFCNWLSSNTTKFTMKRNAGSLIYILTGVAGVARPAGATPTTAVVSSHSTPRRAKPRPSSFFRCALWEAYSASADLFRQFRGDR